VKGHVFLLSLDLNGLLKDLGFTIINNVTTIIEIQQVKGQRHSHKKERGKIRVVSIRSVHYLVAFAPAAGELIIFIAAGC
jgi:hypothetical protein